MLTCSRIWNIFFITMSFYRRKFIVRYPKLLKSVFLIINSYLISLHRSEETVCDISIPHISGGRSSCYSSLLTASCRSTTKDILVEARVSSAARPQCFDICWGEPAYFKSYTTGKKTKIFLPYLLCLLSENSECPKRRISSWFSTIFKMLELIMTKMPFKVRNVLYQILRRFQPNRKCVGTK